MLFAVKCNAHYPGYEVAHASDETQLRAQMPSWKSCKVDTSAILELPDGDIPDELTEKLKVWTDDFTKLH